MDAQEFLTVGKVTLSGLPTTLPEACNRTACGRAYYAAFGVVREVLAPHFKMAGNADDHGALVQLLKRSQDHNVQALGGMLAQLRKARNSSDYDTGSVPVRGRAFDLPFANSQLNLGELIIADVLAAQATDPRLGIP